MMDRISRERRSANMARIQAKDTAPEMVVRKIVHRLGFRFRLHRSELPGKPDLVFPSRKKIILVHGCFWHRHPGCRFAYAPKSNQEFWKEKFEKNVQRDENNTKLLAALGWDVLIIWECETRNTATLQNKIVFFLSGEPILS